jgi:hypothetical protein
MVAMTYEHPGASARIQELFAAGRIVHHPVFPGRVDPAARRIESDEDVEDVIALLRRNYDRIVAASPGLHGAVT